MKVDYFSDIHIDIWFLHKRFGFQKENFGHIDEIQEELVRWLKDRKSDADTIVFAGDAGNGDRWYQCIYNALNRVYANVISIKGNHCFYKTGGIHRVDNVVDQTINGVRFKGTTLFTNFRENYGQIEQEANGRLAENEISDFLWIPEVTGPLVAKGEQWKIYAAKNNEAWKFLLEGKSEVAVTHFPPVIQSLHPKYTGNALNPYFVNDDEIRFAKSTFKYWFHGHVHDPFNYIQNDINVLCWPIGYPTERYQYLEDAPIASIELEL